MTSHGIRRNQDLGSKQRHMAEVRLCLSVLSKSQWANGPTMMVPISRLMAMNMTRIIISPINTRNIFVGQARRIDRCFLDVESRLRKAQPAHFTSSQVQRHSSSDVEPLPKDL